MFPHHQLIANYLESKRWAWSLSTLKSERSRLSPLASLDLDNPQAVWEAIQDRASYTRLTTWTRLTDYYAYLCEMGHRERNVYAEWRRKNARQFKHVYQRSHPSLSFDGARERINSITDPVAREKALQLLVSGLRIGEYGGIGPDGVIGKGGKPRAVTIQASEKVTISDWRFRNELRKVDLKPHDLRKLAATKLYQSGFSVVDLCAVMGWSSFQTASSYIKASENITDKAREVLNGSRKP